MTISFQTQGGHTYGTLCTVTRVGQKVIKTYGESLGRVVDKERLVFYSRSRGLFQYDPETGSYLPAPPDVEMPKRKSRLKVPAQLVSFVFGDVYLLDRFMDKLGLYPVLESAYKDRLDALKAMVCFYLVSTLSNCYAGQWLERSIAHRLFPQAHLSSSQVSDLLKYLGDPSRQQVFFAREHESGTVFLAKWNDRRSSWNGLWPTNSRKTERLSRQSGTLLSQTGTLP